jgi:predicted DNA-binding transcriptional regulator AlpA
MPNTLVADPPRSCQLLDVHQVAAKLQCSWRTVLRHADTGKVPPGHKLGSLRRWIESDIDAFIAAGCEMPSDSPPSSSPGSRS